MVEKSTGTQGSQFTKGKAGLPRKKASDDIELTPDTVIEDSGSTYPVEELTTRLENMERCLSKMAHYTGSNRVLDEFNIPRWEVTKESMRKTRD